MNFDSFVIERKSIISGHLSEVSNTRKSELYQYELQEQEEMKSDPTYKSFSRFDTSFFKMGDPTSDPI